MKLKTIYKMMIKQYPDDNIHLVQDDRYYTLWVNRCPLVKEKIK